MELSVPDSGGVDSLAWGASSDSIYAFSPSPRGWNLIQIGLKGNARILRKFDDSLVASGVTSSDGTQIAMRIWNRRSNVWVMDNF